MLVLDAAASSGDVDEPAKRQHEAPEYLERRRGRRRSTPGFITGINFGFYLVLCLQLVTIFGTCKNIKQI